MSLAVTHPHQDPRAADELADWLRTATALRTRRRDLSWHVEAHPTAGTSLRAALASGRTFDAGEVRRICLHVALGLERAFAGGNVHGDLRPETIHSSGAAGEPPWTLAEPHAHGTAAADGAAWALDGAGDYCAPELAGAEAGFRADQYSLGMVALEATTGKLPSAAERVRFALQWRHQNGLRGIVARLLDPRPDQRFPSHAALVRALSIDENLPLDVWRGSGGTWLLLDDMVHGPCDATGRVGTGSQVPGAERFLPAGHGVFPLVVAGRRLAVVSEEGPATLYTADPGDAYLAASMRYHSVWVLRGGRVGCVDLLTESVAWSPTMPELSRGMGGPPLGLVLSGGEALIGAYGSETAVLLRRAGGRLDARALELPAPLREVDDRGVLCASEGATHSGLFAPGGGLAFRID